MSRGRVWPRQLPWIDASGGLLVGTAMLVLRPLLVGFYGLSLTLITAIAVANLLYSIPGFAIGLSRPRPAWLLQLLIAANLAWFGVCVVLATVVWSSATMFGLAHLLAEGLYVAALALFERKHRAVILAEAGSA